MTALRGEQIKAGDYGNGNRIIGTPKVGKSALLEFFSSGCTVTFGERTAFDSGYISFRRENSAVAIGAGSTFKGQMSLGDNCEISVGTGLYFGAGAYLTTAEGASIKLGNDMIISDRFQARADDSHPIYDGVTGERINRAQSIIVGDHVWIGADVTLMPGARVGSGSVVGLRSVVTKSRHIPDNSLAVGSPAAVQRRNVVWVRKHLQSGHDIADQIEPCFEPDPAPVN